MISSLNILPLHAVVMETGYLRGHWLGECGQQVIAFIWSGYVFSHWGLILSGCFCGVFLSCVVWCYNEMCGSAELFLSSLITSKYFKSVLLTVGRNVTGSCLAWPLTLCCPTSALIHGAAFCCSPFCLHLQQLSLEKRCRAGWCAAIWKVFHCVQLPGSLAALQLKGGGCLPTPADSALHLEAQRRGRSTQTALKSCFLL